MTIKEFNAQPLRPDRLLATVRYYSDKNKRGRVFERVPIVPCYNGDKLMRLKLRTFHVCNIDDSLPPPPYYSSAMLVSLLALDQMYIYPHTKKIILNVYFLEDENEKGEID